VNIHENVQRALMRPPSNHRDPWFPPFYLKLLEDTKIIFKTKTATPIIFPGPQASSLASRADATA